MTTNEDRIRELFASDTVYDYFLGITKTAHPSGKEDPVRAYVVNESKKIKNTKVVLYDESATDPGERVIVLRRPGSGNYARAEPVILQGHMDMVCNPGDMTFPLKLSIKEEDGASWLQARDNGDTASTLGADDGIGVATALALLSDPELEEYPIECLFTVQEETNMGGAMGFDIDKLTGSKLINLDSETLKVIVYGSAGGCRTKYTKNGMQTFTSLDNTWVGMELAGLKGGHSGIAIGKDRLNAIKGLARFLSTNLKDYAPCLRSLERLDSKTSNSIPAEAKVLVGVSGDKAPSLVDAFNAYAAELTDEGVKLTNEQYHAELLAPSEQEALDLKSTSDLIEMLNAVPAGVIKQTGDLVITSTNLFKADIKKEESGWGVEIGSSNRSSDMNSLEKLRHKLESIGRDYGFDVDPNLEAYPMWQPDDKSNLLRISKEVYSAAYDTLDNTEVVHAGLECAVFVEHYKGAGRTLDTVALGPTIRNPHTPNENLLLKDSDGSHPVQQFYDCVKQIIKKVF